MKAQTLQFVFYIFIIILDLLAENDQKKSLYKVWNTFSPLCGWVFFVSLN